MSSKISKQLRNNKMFSSVIEVVPKRFLFATFTQEDFDPLSVAGIVYIRCEDFLDYEGFYNDFGPYNLSNLYRYCNYVNEKMEELQLDDNNDEQCIVQYTSANKEERLNSAFAVGTYVIIYLNRTADEAYRLLSDKDSVVYHKYNDASINLSEYKLPLLDCLHAVERSHRCGFFNFADFNFKEYEYYENVESGDLNWIVPDKFIAFCGPHQQAIVDNKGYLVHAPNKYFTYFRENNVTTVIRLNCKFYEAALFTDAGFKHYDLIFRDGSTPNDIIMNQFLEICEQTEGVIAVHCKAGLGRTGSLIGAYIMKHYRFTALEAIAWIRICRPGSVIGHQQQWLEDKQVLMWSQGEAYRRERHITTIRVHKQGVYCYPTKKCDAAGSKLDKDEQNKKKSTASDGSIKKKAARRGSQTISGISEKVDTMNINDDNLLEVTATEPTPAPSINCHLPKNLLNLRARRIEQQQMAAAAAKNNQKQLPASPSKKNFVAQPSIPTTQGDELNQIKSRRAFHHYKSYTVNTNHPSDTPANKFRHHSRAKSQTVHRSSTTNSSTGSQHAADLMQSLNANVAQTVVRPNPSTQKCNSRYTCLLIRPPANQSGDQQQKPSANAEANSEGTAKPIITKKSVKDESNVKRVSVRRIAPGKKLVRSLVKGTVTATLLAKSNNNNNNDDDETSVNAGSATQAVKSAGRRLDPSKPDITGPVTRSKSCKSCLTVAATNENSKTNAIAPHNSHETNAKRGKRSLSNSRLHEKKNKLSRKTQSLTAEPSAARKPIAKCFSIWSQPSDSFPFDPPHDPSKDKEETTPPAIVDNDVTSDTIQHLKLNATEGTTTEQKTKIAKKIEM